MPLRYKNTWLVPSLAGKCLLLGPHRDGSPKINLLWSASIVSIATSGCKVYEGTAAVPQSPQRAVLREGLLATGIAYWGVTGNVLVWTLLRLGFDMSHVWTCPTTFDLISVSKFAMVIRCRKVQIEIDRAVESGHVQRIACLWLQLSPELKYL